MTASDSRVYNHLWQHRQCLPSSVITQRVFTIISDNTESVYNDLWQHRDVFTIISDNTQSLQSGSIYHHRWWSVETRVVRWDLVTSGDCRSDVQSSAHHSCSSPTTIHDTLHCLSDDFNVVVAYAFRSHNWSARQRHHHLQSVVWTSHHVVLSVGRIQQYVTSFGSHRRNTGRSLWVSISSYRHRSDLVRCGSGSGETNVVEGEQNPAVGLWGRPRGGHWPPRPTSRILSTDCWCQLVSDGFNVELGHTLEHSRHYR